MKAKIQGIAKLVILSMVLGAAAGCAPASSGPTVVPTPTLRPGWETHSASLDQGGCGYAIDHPSDMEVTSQGTYSWTLSHTATEPSGPLPNFVYISVIPDGFPQSGNEPGAIYNYVPAETQALLSLQVGESKSLREDPSLGDWFKYTRLPDVLLYGGRSAQAYKNDQPWEFPPGTKEIRYYLKANGCTYLIGGYMATVGSGQPGAIDQKLFEQIIASFRPAP